MPDIVISLTAGQAARLEAALTTSENPSPTLDDAKQICVRVLRGRVLQHERRVAESAINDTPFEPT